MPIIEGIVTGWELENIEMHDLKGIPMHKPLLNVFIEQYIGWKDHIFYGKGIPPPTKCPPFQCLHIHLGNEHKITKGGGKIYRCVESVYGMFIIMNKPQRDMSLQ